MIYFLCYFIVNKTKHKKIFINIFCVYEMVINDFTIIHNWSDKNKIYIYVLHNPH